MSVLLWIAVLLGSGAAVLSGIALFRLRTPLERLHAGSFAGSLAGFAFAAAAFVTDGFTGRSLKMALIFFLFTLGGAAANHATARALLYRGGERR